MHYFKFNIGEYASHTRHLSPIEDIAYRRLLDLAYTTELPLIKDIRQLTRIINLREYQQEVEDVLKEFFFEVEDGWLNNRVVKEIEKTGEKSESAKNSAAIRWDSERKAKRMQEQCDIDANASKNNANASKSDATNNPITNNQLPNTHYQEPITKKPSSPPNGNEPPNQKNDDETELQFACRQTWAGYTSSYFQRYGTEPVRNATVNTQVKNFVKRIGYAESPFVASWFLEHSDAFYVRAGHAFNLLTKDAEKLRTEWATGRRITQTKAKQIEKTGALGDAVSEIMQKRATT